MLRFRVLGASCFGLCFRVLRFRNYPKKGIFGLTILLKEADYDIKNYADQGGCYLSTTSAQFFISQDRQIQWSCYYSLKIFVTS